MSFWDFAKDQPYYAAAIVGSICMAAIKISKNLATVLNKEPFK